MLRVRHNGTTYENLISASVQTSIGTLCGAFSITTSANKDQALPIKRGDKVVVLADWEPICTGYVDGIRGSYSDGQHTLTFFGRDQTQDVADSTVGKRKEFKGGVTLTSVIEAVLSDLGLSSSIKVINKAGFLPAFSSTEVTSAKVGQNAFEFLESYARKRQVLVTTDGSGNIILLRGGGTPSGIKLIHTLLDKERRNNILSSEFQVDDSKRYAKYTAQTQGNPLFSFEEDTAKKLTSSKAVATDTGVRSSRQMEFESSESMSSADLADRVKWEANLRRAQSLQYSAVVQGHTFNGKVWRFNELAEVDDEMWDLKATLLINAVDYGYSLGEGSTCSLTMTYSDAYTLEEKLNALEKNTSKTGDKFVLDFG